MKLVTLSLACAAVVSGVESASFKSAVAQNASNLRSRYLQQQPDPPATNSSESPTNQDPPATNATLYQKDWWDLGMGDEILDQVSLFYLGETWFQGADVGEVLETMSRCDPNDPWSWSKEWLKTAKRIEALGDESAAGGHSLTAGQSYLRAATYYRTALHRHPDPYDPEVPVMAQTAVDMFVKFLDETDYPCKPVEIPYEDTTLPAYLCLNPNVDGPAPTIIFNEGKDGWAEDGKFVVDEAQPRGYHVLLFDGPGIGKVMRLQGLPFRHDWENVITPIVDYLVELDEVDEDNIALISVSLGGYLGPRAAAFEHRLKALVANPGIIYWGRVYEDFLSNIDSNLIPLLDTDPEAFDATIYQIMELNQLMQWGMIDSMWHHNAATPSGLMNELRRFTNVPTVQNITAKTLVIDAEMEEFGQSKELYDALTCEKSYIMFTLEEGAQLHVQPGATAIHTLRVFNWLDDVFAESVTVSSSSTESAAPKYATILALSLASCLATAMSFL